MIKPSLSVLQISMLIIITIGLDNHVTVIPLLLRAANKDSWIGVLIALIPCALWTYLPYAIGKRSGQQPVLAFLKQRVGAFASISAFAVFFVILLCNAGITFKEVILWTKITYLPATPMLATSLTLIGLCVFSAYKGIKTIAITTGVLLPFVWLFGYFVMTANFQYKRYGLLLPSFTNSVSDFMDCILYAASSFMQMFVVVLLQHHLRDKLRWRHLVIVILLIAMLTIGPLIGSIAAFGLESALMRYPAFEQWRLVRIGDYISHVDFLSIYQWMSGAYILISLMLYLMAEIVRTVMNVPKMATILVMALVLLVFVNMPQIGDIEFIDFISWYYRGSFFLIAAFSIALFAASFKSSKRKAGAR